MSKFFKNQFLFIELGPKDLRVKNQWVKHATVKGATGVKIVGRDDLEKALAGLPLYVARRDDEVEYFKDLLERKRIKLARMTMSGPVHIMGQFEDPDHLILFLMRNTEKFKSH